MTLEKINRLNELLIGVLKLAYLNLLWLVTVVCGLGLTFGPACAAMLHYYDRWSRKKEELPVFRSYWRFLKRDFKRSLIIGLIYELMFAVILGNLFLLKNWYLLAGNVLILVILLISFTHVFSLLGVLPAERVLSVFKVTTVLGFGYLHYTILAWTGIIGSYLLLAKFAPAALFLFGIALTGFFLGTASKLVLGELEKVNGTI